MTTSEAPSTHTPPRVVVGVDGSSASLKALQWALDYASATHSQIDVVAAWEWPTTLAWSAPFPSRAFRSGHPASGGARRPGERAGVGITWRSPPRRRAKGTQ
jgi:nucleotide-binding universal stress UspA family protein